MKTFVIIKKHTSYFTQTINAETLEQAIADAEEFGEGWDLIEHETETYGQESN